MREIIINNQAEMIDLANKIANEFNREFKSINFSEKSDKVIENIDCKTIALYGSLGVGKSFFAKNFINNLQEKKEEILSPTFNIVCNYNTKIGEVFHLDLYRLKSSFELENIDFFSIVNNNFTLIEWPEIAEKYLPKNYLSIKIESFFDEKNNQDFNHNSQRKITLNHVTNL